MFHTRIALGKLRQCILLFRCVPESEGYNCLPTVLRSSSILNVTPIRMTRAFVFGDQRALLGIGRTSGAYEQRVVSLGN